MPVEAFRQISQRFVHGWEGVLRTPFVWVALAFVVVFVAWPRDWASRKLGRVGAWVVLGLLLAALLVVSLNAAWGLRWVCDDAFISFRYADNLVHGRGLVFNPGEKVEGYTNFLWTLLVAGGIAAGVHPGQFTLVAGLLTFAAVLLVTERLVLRLSPEEPRPTFPFAAAVIGLNYVLQSYATSGLETMFAALLTIVAVERAAAGALLAAGFAGIGAVLAHPDHAILYAALGGSLLLRPEYRRHAWRYAVPFVAVYLPYFAWRTWYYGDLFPNTYYAKSGGALYFDQGAIYLVVSALAGGFWGLLPLTFVGAWYTRRSVVSSFTLIGVPLYLVYVAKVGGDFMLGRLVCTAIPPLAVLAEVGLRHLLCAKHRVLAAFAMVPAFAVFARVPIVLPGEKFFHVADERTFYGLASFSPLRVISPSTSVANALNRHFTSRGLRPTVALGCVGIVGYETKLPLVDTFGLTDKVVAHTPIAVRSRPGHEKHAAPGYLFDRGVQLWDFPFYPEPYAAQTRVMLDQNPFYLSRQDPALIASLRASRAGLPLAMNVRLEQYLRDEAPRTPDAAACDLWFFEQYYFRANTDPSRQERLLAVMAAESVFPAGAEPFFGIATSVNPPGWKRVRTVDFESQPKGWLATGNAFTSWPSTRPALGQDQPAAVQGRYIDTFVDLLADEATGKLVSPAFTVQGDFLTFQIAGGRDRDNTSLTMYVNELPVASATGCSTEIAGRRVFDLRPYKGKPARIEITDGSRGGWGHVVVDEIVEWARE